MTPEEEARETIDAYLRAAGWGVQDRDAMNLFDPSRPGVAMREAHLKTGYGAYLLFGKGKMLYALKDKTHDCPGSALSRLKSITTSYSR